MSGRLIWFLGPSSAGKSTLISAVSNDTDDELRVHLRIEEPVRIVSESLDDTQNRDELAELIHSRHSPRLTQLVKGQSSDIWDESWGRPVRDIPGYLGALLPDCSQEAVFVWADVEDLDLRCRIRGQDIDCALETALQTRWTKRLTLPTLCVKNPTGGPIDIGACPPDW